MTTGELEVRESFWRAVSSGAIDIREYLKTRRTVPKISSIDFLYRYLRYNALFDFNIFCALVDLPIDRNPVYREFYDKYDEKDSKLIRLEHKRNILLIKNVDISDIESEIEVLKKKRTRNALLEIPRGCLKSTFLIARSNWKYLRDVIIRKRTPTIIMLHGDIDKASENLELVRANFKSPVIQELYYDVLEMTQDTKRTIRFKDESKLKRKENHLQVGSVNSEMGGKHFTYWMVDDWHLDKNSNSPEKNQMNKKAFYKLFSLDDRSGYSQMEMVGTEYWDDGLYVELKQKPNFFYVCKPAYDINTDTYNFPEVLDKEELDFLKETLPPQEYNSQYQMTAYSRDQELNLVDNNDFLFAFKDEEAPVGVERIDITKAEFMREAGIITSKDPSYSKINKSSRDATVTAGVLNGVTYYIDEFRTTGGRTEEIYQYLKQQVARNRSDVVIVDSQAYQFNTALDFRDWLDRDGLEIQNFIMYKKPKIDTKGKVETAIYFLQGKFPHQIRVHFSLKHLIAEIRREETTFDFIDTMVQVASVRPSFIELYGGKEDEEEYYNNNNYIDRSEEVSSITGY